MNTDTRQRWGQVFAANRVGLQHFLRRHIGQAWDIEDIAQETYVRVLRLDEKVARDISDPRAYLFTVAANLVKEHALVHRRDSRTVNVDDVLPLLQAPQGSAEDVAARTLQRERLTRMLGHLPPRCRAVLVMQHRDGMSYAEIAERLGVSSHMVKKYVVRALSLCRGELGFKG